MTFTDDEARAIMAAAKQGVETAGVVLFSGPDELPVAAIFQIGLNDLLARLTAAGFEIERGWRPIAEAQDGVACLVFDDPLIRTGYKYQSGWSTFSGMAIKPTHFRPLPNPPNGAT